MKKYLYLLLIAICFLSLFLNIFKQSSCPPCFNADEAAFGYNAFSIAETSKDEYGTLLPLRLKSFGDYKLPLYSYLSAPIVGIFGLSEFSTRFLNHILAFLFPAVIYLLVMELFNRRKIALLTAFLTSLSVGLHIVSRQAHEAPLASFLVALSVLFFLKALRTFRIKYVLLHCLFLLLSLFSYQSNRIFAAFFFIYSILLLVLHRSLSKKYLNLLLLIIVVIGIFTITDLIYKPERVKNLLFLNNSGFTSRINELRGENGSRILYNKVSFGLRHVALEHLTYISPQFLAINGDANYRFGFPQMSPLTPLEYLFILVGIYYLFKNKEKWRYFLTSLFLITPITASLSWQETSLTRSLFMFIPALIVSAYGFVYLIENIKKYKKITILVLISVELFFLLYSWDFYFNHYPKRAIVIKNWQCGYKDLVSYINSRYEKFDKFYITKKHGQPYIFLLFYMQFDPTKYQSQAKLSPPDEYGFGQVEKFDKFIFSFPSPSDKEKAVFIGYPDDFNNTVIDKSKIKVIRSGTEEIFWIYESNLNKKTL